MRKRFGKVDGGKKRLRRSPRIRRIKKGENGLSELEGFSVTVRGGFPARIAAAAGTHVYMYITVHLTIPLLRIAPFSRGKWWSAG